MFIKKKNFGNPLYFIGEAVIGDVEVLQIREVQTGNRIKKSVLLEPERQEVGQIIDQYWNLVEKIIVR